MGRPSRCPSGERGTTLLEITVVASIVAVVALALLQAVDATARVEQGVNDRVTAVEDLDRALEAVASDLAAGEPAADPLGLSAGSAAAALTSDELGNPRIVLWVRTGTTLDRLVVEPVGGTVRERVTMFEGLDDTGDPTFRWFDARGAELDPARLSSNRLAACTARVRISLAFAAGAVGRAGSRDVALRTGTNEVNGC